MSTYNGLNHTIYTAGRLIGRGGEGQVFETKEHPSLLVKIYNETPDTDKANKLRHMVAMQSPDILHFAAWPTDLVSENGRICGFVMKKLSGYVPLHMLFSPMDRKKLFPNKGYNFLVHVARNLASAFHKLHEAGLIIGDINEGNILVDEKGMIAFIDCDSFQIRAGDRYYYCEVGVPRYTPPELLAAQSFHNTARTINTDSFSLAILLFQLLFLGRHPFAGRNNSKDDFDEEKAIREHQFAYSLHNRNKKLLPPLNSLAITSLPQGIIQLFHQAFEQDSSRPLPQHWVQQLDVLSKEIVTCTKFKLHTYPSQLAQCPWCAFKEQNGIVYFLDDSFLKTTPLPVDFQQFINGFRPEKLVLKQLSPQYTVPATLTSMIAPEHYRYRKWHIYSLVLALLPLPVLLVVNHWLLLGWGGAVVIGYNQSPWRRKLKEELKRRESLLALIQSKLEALVRAHNAPTDLSAYNKQARKLEDTINEFRNLPNQLQDKKKELEEDLYNKQLSFYLYAFNIEDYPIPSFGNAKKQLLYDNGIRTASDVSQLLHTKITGIGPKNLQILLSWQRQMAAGFTYHPNYDLLGKEIEKLNADMAKEKAKLEAAIKRHYQALQLTKTNILARQQAMEGQYMRLVSNAAQAETDVAAFKKLI